MDNFTNPDLETMVVGIVLLLAGYSLRALKALIVRTPTKLDDAIWNKLVGELVAVGTISPEQLQRLHNLPASNAKAGTTTPQ